MYYPKFRGISKYDEIMIEGGFTLFENKPCIIDFYTNEIVEIIPNTLSQGLDAYDKNGKQLFCGDIVKIGLSEFCILMNTPQLSFTFMTKEGHCQAGCNVPTLAYAEIIGDIWNDNWDIAKELKNE